MNLPASNLPWLWNNTLFLTKHGSHAYGMATPTSDLDLRGFCIPPREYFFGYRSKFEQAIFEGDPDIVVYDIRKFFNLASQCNPNVIEILFTEPADHVIVTDKAKKILAERDSFLSAKAYHTFGGFAVQQLMKIHAKQNANGQYNFKDAMHLFRLMRVCREILTDGKVTVKRPDCAELLAIRNGSMTYDQVVQMATELNNELKVLYTKTSLPKEPDHVKLEALLIDVVTK